MALSSPAIDGRNLIATMLLGIGNTAVEVVAINKIKHLLKHIALLFLHLAGILPTAKHQHQIVALP